MEMKDIGKDVYVVEDAVPHLTQADIVDFKRPVRQTARMRRRLCTHVSIEDKLHEMFVTYVKETYVHPNKHMGKDESLHILEGRADFVFFDEEGEIIEVVPLGAYDSGVNFYCRIPAGIYHTWIINSDVIVVHETTPGPFDRTDTIFAPWAPGEEDPAAAERYIADLSVRSARFLADRGRAPAAGART